MKHANYPPDWEKRRYRVFKRDGFQCRNCEYEAPEDDPKTGLHCHHQTRISNGGGHGLDNLVTVCEDCHYQIHSNSGIDRVPPDNMQECAYDGCDEVRGPWALHHGGYCNSQCEYRDKAEAALDNLRTIESFCSSCFSNWPSNQEVCPECGNWAPDEEEAFRDGDLDIENLAAHIIREHEYVQRNDDVDE